MKLFKRLILFSIVLYTVFTIITYILYGGLRHSLHTRITVSSKWIMVSAELKKTYKLGFETNVVNKPSSLTIPNNKWKDILKLKSEGYHSFNATKSDDIPITRDIIDSRPPGCRHIEYDITTLSPVSIIIIFHNEAWSTLLRTITSVLKRTPQQLLIEIILVDDASTYEWLLQPLQKYVEHFPIINLIRHKQRQGLIRARMTGARSSRAEVLVFIDSHTEVNIGWLEPMLERIKLDPTIVPIPYMDPINYKTFDYMKAFSKYYGGFSWNLEYYYPRMRQNLIDSLKETDPIPNPVMVGCAHAVNRQFFFDTGAYDEDMDIWGGENIEHSFRIWMCGGRVEELPCSRVGHVFKPKLPYSFNGDSHKIITRNLIRTAEVWMDDYKKYFYATQDTLVPVDIVTLKKRLEIKTKLNCRSFKWYLDTVFPEMVVPTWKPLYFGKLQTEKKDKCVVLNNDQLELGDCEIMEDTFSISQTYQFMYLNKSCVTDSPRGTNLTTEECGTTPEWRLNDKKQIRHRDLCLDSKENLVLLDICDDNKLSQKWSFRYRFNFTKGNWDAYKAFSDEIKRPPGAVEFGGLKNTVYNQCLNIVEGKVHLLPCKRVARFDRIFQLNVDNVLKLRHLCISVKGYALTTTEDCPSATAWIYKKQMLRTSDGLCVTARDLKLALFDCVESDKQQQWIFTDPSI